MLVNQRDPIATASAGFHSKKSYISFACHVYLYGVRDHAEMRLRIFERAKGMCQLCPVPHYIPWTQGEWHHAQKTFGGRRCDGLCCGKWCCKKSHDKETNRSVKWTNTKISSPKVRNVSTIRNSQ